MLYAIVAVIFLILDQAVKYWTTVNIVADTGTRELIPGLIRLTNVHNTGAAFSFLEGARWFFVILCVLFVALVIYALARRLINTPVARWMAVIVLAGAVGNCIDRIICGYVVDMFEFEFVRFPVFNVADICITVGAVLFAVCVLCEKDSSAKTAKAEKEPLLTPSGKAIPARAHESAPKRRSFKKTVIPDFPVHSPAEQPKVDPNDPFAEWERRAAAKSQQPSVGPAPQPAAAPQPVPQPIDAKPIDVRPTPTASASEPTVRNTSAPSPKAQADAGTIAAAADELSFDLDDILAEFKDL